MVSTDALVAALSAGALTCERLAFACFAWRVYSKGFLPFIGRTWFISGTWSGFVDCLFVIYGTGGLGVLTLAQTFCIGLRTSSNFFRLVFGSYLFLFVCLLWACGVVNCGLRAFV